MIPIGFGTVGFAVIRTGETAVTLQFQLDYDQKLSPSAQLGMQQADENAYRVEKICGRMHSNRRAEKQEFTVDDVLAELEKLPNPPETHNLRSAGAPDGGSRESSGLYGSHGKSSEVETGGKERELTSGMEEQNLCGLKHD